MKTTLDPDDKILLAVNEYRDGVPVLPRRGDVPVVTTEIVNRLLNEVE